MFNPAARHVGHPLLGFFLTFLVFGGTAYALSRTEVLPTTLRWGSHILLQLDPTLLETGHWS